MGHAIRFIRDGTEPNGTVRHPTTLCYYEDGKWWWRWTSSIQVQGPFDTEEEAMNEALKRMDNDLNLKTPPGVLPDF
jgi:hypothetical protein